MDTMMKKKEEKTPALTDFIFSWSIADVMNKDLYRDKVNRIPTIFSSADHYFKSFVYPLIEETRADLRSNITTVFHAPAREIYNVKCKIDGEQPEKLLYKLTLKQGAYEPEFGDLIALTEVKPKCIDDLDRPKRPYTVAFVQGMKSEGSLKIPILSSKPIMFEKEDKEKRKEGDKLFAVYLTNLTTNLRIWKALHPDINGGNINIINSVMRTSPSEEQHCSICSSNEIESTSLSKSRKNIDHFGLDDSQKLAVLNCVATIECRHLNSVKLIWGPPGTGKTKTTAALAFALLKIKCRTLTCAPTNVAVIGVTKRLMSLLGDALEHGTYGLGDIVLFGNGERMKIDDHEDLLDVFLTNRVSVLGHCFAPLTGWKGSLESMISLLEDPEGQYLQYMRKERTENNEESDKDVNDDEEDNENELSTKEKSSGSLGKEGKSKNEIHAGMPVRKFWKELIVRDLKENKKKKTMRTSERSRSKCDEKDKNAEASGNGNKLWTFEEFVIKMFRKKGDGLMLCMTGLYTHMPTSYLPLKVLNNMIRVLKMLQVLQTLLDNCNQSKEGLRQAFMRNEEIGRIKSITSLHQIRVQCLEVLKSLRGSFSVPNIIDPYHIRNFCLKNACLIFCTVSSSAKLHTEGMTPIKLVIIDEAAQLKECESSIPLQLSGLCHAILVGDEKQLPAMVQSKICEKACFGRSLFERLVILGHSKHLLNVQYRMHPSISLFPNREFYGNRIKNGQNVMQRAYERRFLNEKTFGSYSFIDINNGKEEFDDRNSRKNMVEVSAVAEIISKLYRESTHSNQKVRVGCISPYKAQVSAIRERLGNAYSTDTNDQFSVNVRSVDGFQGGEEDMIIISTVRCNGNGSVGFLSNYQRTNVSLTRARYCLWILGNGATLLNSGSIWKKLILDAKSRGCFYNGYENKSLAMAIGNALSDLGQLNSLFCTDSILFRVSEWKVCFASEFHESMIRHQNSGIHENVVSLLVKLSNGWRQPLKDQSLGITKGASSQLLQSYDIKGILKLIWTTDIRREDSKDIQVIKIWDVLPKFEVPKLAKKLDAQFGNYTYNHISRCLCKRIEGDLTLPMTWTVDTDARSHYSSKDSVHELTRKLDAMSLRDEAGSSTSRSKEKTQVWRRTLQD